MATNNSTVKFVEISRASFNSLTKDVNTFYVVIETDASRKLYQGANILTSSADINEAWITPTLINGATGDVQYRKNRWGRVEWRGRLIVANTNLPQMYLPAAYLPAFDFFNTFVINESLTITVAFARTWGIHVYAKTGTIVFNSFSYQVD